MPIFFMDWSFVSNNTPSDYLCIRLIANDKFMQQCSHCVRVIRESYFCVHCLAVSSYLFLSFLYLHQTNLFYIKCIQWSDIVSFWIIYICTETTLNCSTNYKYCTGAQWEVKKLTFDKALLSYHFSLHFPPSFSVYFKIRYKSVRSNVLEITYRNAQ